MTVQRQSSGASEKPAGELSEAQASRLLVERTVLDEQAEAARRRDPQTWGVWTWLGPLLVLAAMIVVGNVVVPFLAPHGGAGRRVVAVVTAVGGELLLLAALLAFGRAVAARAGGWRAAFGLDRIRKRDWLPWILGFGIIYAFRTAVTLVAAVTTHGRALREANNLVVGRPTVLSVVVLFVIVALLAPITEELMFRGLLLRSFLRRMAFWPAALLSSALFALFHIYEVHTVLGAVTLALSVGVLGLGNSFVVRITGRLAPAMMIHATYNALVLIIALAAASR